MKLLLLFILLSIIALGANAGLIAYGVCQTGCNALAVSCYAAAGFAFGTVTAGLGTLAAILSCNTSLGTCMTACVLAGVVTPA